MSLGMKKSIIFVIDSLHCAGAEKSLITFLSTLDFNKFEVDLQLFQYGGILEQFIPKEVNVLPMFPYTKFLKKSIVKQILSFDFKKNIARWRYSVALRLGKKLSNIDNARLYWKSCRSVLPNYDKQYDIAVAYAQSIPTFYVSDKVKAKLKLSWVNCEYDLSPQNMKFQEKFYKKIDNIVVVSDAAKEVLKNKYPQFVDKMVVIWDMLNADVIKNMSNIETQTNMDKSIPCLLTVARLNKEEKGFDIALEACKILKDKGITFKWYVVGQGPYREEMETFILQNNLQDTFIFLGTTANPYPYYKDCTIYVQTSRHEGFGLSIAESRILNRPVVTTEFDAVYNQMIQGKNGLVVKQEPLAVADAIELLLNDKDLYQEIQEFQKNEKKGNLEEIEKFYRIIEDSNI